MTGFEPATPGPPDQCANRAAPHPEHYKPFFKGECKDKEFAIFYNMVNSICSYWINIALITIFTI